MIYFEVFRATLEDDVLIKVKKKNAGVKPYDVVMLFKILILQRYFELSGQQIEYQIIDRTMYIISHKLQLSITDICSMMKDEIVRTTINLSVHSAGELTTIISRLERIEGMEEVKRVTI